MAVRKVVVRLNFFRRLDHESPLQLPGFKDDMFGSSDARIIIFRIVQFGEYLLISSLTLLFWCLVKMMFT